MTPKAQGLEKQIISPEDGWEEGIYLIDVAYGPFNIIHRAILSISFPKDIAHPCHWIMGSYEDLQHINWVYYLKPVKKLADKEEMEIFNPTVNT